jgi:hypothetical protein
MCWCSREPIRVPWAHTTNRVPAPSALVGCHVDLDNKEPICCRSGPGHPKVGALLLATIGGADHGRADQLQPHTWLLLTSDCGDQLERAAMEKIMLPGPLLSANVRLSCSNVAC